MPQQQQDGKRSRGGFRRAADRARPVLEAVAGRHGFAQADVLLRWTEIAGEALAPTCRPIRVSYRGDRRLGATLVVQADSARAPEVEHLAPRIIERVNQFYGYRAVSRIRITQSGQRGSFAEAPTPFTGPSAPATPTEADTTRAAQLTEGIEDADLRAALTRLGAHVLARGRAPAK